MRIILMKFVDIFFLFQDSGNVNYSKICLAYVCCFKDVGVASFWKRTAILIFFMFS